MQFLIVFSLFSLIVSAPLGIEDDEELPFNTENFSTFFDEPHINPGEEKDELALSYSDHADTMKKRLKMKSMFNTNGPPSIGIDLFSDAAVEDNLKKLSYEGSGEGVDENVSSTTVKYSLSGNDSAVEDSFVESSSNNSSMLYEQNTSDAEVETPSDTIYQKNEAVENTVPEEIITKYDKEDEGVIEGSKSTTVLEISDYSGNDTTSKVSCPPPKVCGKNCFITINEGGCQDCQCLWIAQECAVDTDCTENDQFCDLGKCNCKEGFEQDMQNSGVCKAENLGNNEITDNSVNRKSAKRNKRAAKPRLSERLEWPGVCDKNEQCPDNLVCIHGDCWSIPDKLRRTEMASRIPNMIISRNTDDEEEEEKIRNVSFDTDKIMELTTTTTPTPVLMTTRPNFVINPITDDYKRGMARFVSEDFAKQLQRTTAKIKKYDWFPPTTTVSPLTTEYPITTKVSPPAPPLTVDQFFIIETTVSPSPLPPTPRKIEDDHKMEYLKERKPNFLGVKEEALEIEHPVSSESHIKKIHLEMPPSLLQHRRKPKRMRTTPSPDDASEIEEMNNVDEIEFPISSKIKSGVMKPRALSAEPTREELKDHKSLVDLFNSHAASVSDKTEEIEPSFQILQSFSDSNPSTESTSDIHVTLATEAPEPKFSPVPDLFVPESLVTERKPWMILQGKLSNTAPLGNISGDMASDDPPEVTPQPAPFHEHQIGVWYPMKKGDIPHLGIFSGEFRRSPITKSMKTSDEIRLYHEYTKSNRQNRPIKIEMDNATGYMRNECRNDKNCGSNTVCCTKKWCDRSNNCGTGKFCLTSCSSTKLTFLPFSDNAESVIDIMYD